MNKVTGIISFVLGAAAGSVATWYIVKKKYEAIAQEEIDSVKEFYENNKEKEAQRKKFVDNLFDGAFEQTKELIEEAKEKADLAKEKPCITEYASKINDEGYTDYSSAFSSDKEVIKQNVFDIQEEETMKQTKPYVISPEEFGENEDYDRISLTYYEDDYLADDLDELVEDIDSVVGLESLNHFGEYEDDSVYVRNDRLKADYEILMSARYYEDVIKNKPHL